MTDVHQTVSLPARPQAVFDALMTSEGLKGFSSMEAAVSAEEGGAWSAFEGGVHGRNIEVVPPERIVQAWRAANWEPGQYSVVRFELAPQGDGTQITLVHSGLPTGTAEHIAAGWHARYWEPMRAWLMQRT